VEAYRTKIKFSGWPNIYDCREAFFMKKKQFVGIVGSSGIVGTDPFDVRCWSGSGRNFFLALQKAGLLHRAFGVDALPLVKYLLALKNFSTDKTKWRNKLHLDTLYYRALSQQVARSLTANDFNFNILQVGAIYNVPAVVQNRSLCFSYHDGNIAQMMQSPFFIKELKPYALKAKMWEKEVYDQLSKIFTMSDYLRQSFIADFNIPSDKVVNVGAGVNFIFPEIKDKQHDSKEIVFVGMDFYRKGGDTLLKAYEIVRQAHPESRLNIIGPVSVPEEIRTNELKNISFYGYLSKDNSEQLEKFYNILTRSAIGVLPSRYEPFGIALVEMMSYAMPCVATNRWAFPEMITPGSNGYLIEPDDYETLAQILLHYLENPDLIKEHGLRSRKIAKKYTWELVVENISKSIS